MMDDDQDPLDTAMIRRSRRRRRGPPPAFVSGTSTEFLGRKPLPRAVQLRPVVFLLGPRGVGKTQVACHLLPAAMRLPEQQTRAHIRHYLLQGEWPAGLADAPALIIESPCFLDQRPPFSEALQALLTARARAGRRTVVIEAVDELSVQQNLLGTIPLAQRATVVLRFPKGRGRQRFAARACDELGISRQHARAVKDLEPWSYDAIYRVLRTIKAAGE